MADDAKQDDAKPARGAGEPVSKSLFIITLLGIIALWAVMFVVLYVQMGKSEGTAGGTGTDDKPKPKSITTDLQTNFVSNIFSLGNELFTFKISQDAMGHRRVRVSVDVEVNIHPSKMKPEWRKYLDEQLFANIKTKAWAKLFDKYEYKDYYDLFGEEKREDTIRKMKKDVTDTINEYLEGRDDKLQVIEVMIKMQILG